METTNKKLAERITKGHFTKDSLAVKAHGAGTVALCPVPQDGGVMSCVANSELILEAFQVANETGLSPRELKEQRDEAVKFIESLQLIRRPICEGNTGKAIYQNAMEFLGKVKPQ